MKNTYIIISAVLIVSMLFFPLLCREPQSEGPKKEEKAAESDTFLVYFPETEKIEQMPADEYIWSVVAAEMPAEYDKEALKAQAVAAYTFADYRRNLRLDGKVDRAYDVAADHTTDQAFVDKEKARSNWGEKYDEYSTKIASAVESVSGEKMTYGGETILAAYYSVSSGRTENCLDIWGSDKAYLVSVNSSFDKTSPKYKVETKFTESTLKEKLKEVCDFVASPDAFSINARSEGGSVMSVTVCGGTIKGTKLRTLLELRSANFEIEYNETDKTYIITTYGYGHGIGMSQYGANCLAKEGKSYKEILEYFYTDVEIKKAGA